MPKRLRDEPIYLAPQIIGFRNKYHEPVLIDERSGRELNPSKIDDKIYVYQRQVDEWFLKRAARLCQREHNNFIVVMIAISYIEGVEQYRNGRLSNGRSKQYFLDGMKRIFRLNNVTDDQLETMYKHLRCGLFHNGMSGDSVVLNTTLEDAIIFSNRGTIDINPKLFLNFIINDFNQYINELNNQNNTVLRNNFDSMFSNL